MTKQRSNYKIPRRTFLKVCAAAAAAGLTACGKTQATAALPELTVGSDNYPPFIYLNNDSMPTGIDVDIATEAFARIGYAVRFEIIDWEQKTNLVESGANACNWGCFSMDGREQLYRCVGPYMVSRQVVAVIADSGIETLADLAGKSCGFQPVLDRLRTGMDAVGIFDEPTVQVGSFLVGVRWFDLAFDVGGGSAVGSAGLLHMEYDIAHSHVVLGG